MTTLQCPDCEKLYNSMTKEEKERGVGMNGKHILTTARGDCPRAWNRKELGR